MPYSANHIVVTVLGRALDNLRAILAKGKAHAQERKVDEAVFLNSRLYPDMFQLTRQVHVATDVARGAAARLSGAEPPTYENNEQTFDELIARIDKTLAYLGTLSPAQIDGSEQRDITLKVGPNMRSFKGQVFLLHYAMPNFYFHVTTAYDILRHCGVNIGKRDFIGQVG